MSFVNIKESNKTIMLISFFMVFLGVYWTLGLFHMVSLTSLLTSPLGVGIVALMFGLILYFETWQEGNPPSISDMFNFKDMDGIMLLLTNILMVILFTFGGLTLFKHTVPLIILTLLPTAVLLSTLVLGKELLFD